MHDLDQELHRRLQQRDPRALEELIQQYASRLLYLIRQVLGGLGTVEDAEEVLAETFVIIWYDIEQYDPNRAPLTTWMWMRAKYAALDRRRQLRRRRDTLPLQEGRASPARKEEGLGRADRWDLHKTLSILPELERELVYRRYFLQESLKEIADQVDLSVHAIRNRLWRTRKRLANLIQARSDVDYLTLSERDQAVAIPS